MSIDREHILKKDRVARPIFNITPFTLLDYPGHTACILWFAGCNMRCLYCYNPQIVTGKGKLYLEQALDFIYSRRTLLDGVVLSGGECTLHSDLIPLTKIIKTFGLKIKIDTNGALPSRINELLEEKLIDYVALDFKSLPKNFQHITGSNLFEQFETTLLLLMGSNVEFEVRTTVHSELIDREEVKRMVSYLEKIGYKGVYYIQQFRNDAETIGKMGSSSTLQDLRSLSTPNIEVVDR
ncbi:anaerobic ribonucleoside-triphosphate reductase activating protein [Litoribacter ruber]|uniref:anaerobic ribonucleoside-triphosphate reductase activating protein n=1 Tax=Litoribacter ruber TaxID=702568 RepID=UPI00293D4B7A|nr:MULTISPECIES: anaerobic ribonucleoside-triphosphate reductase activating protein [Litoribacter]